MMTSPFSFIFFGTILLYCSPANAACSTTQDDPRCATWVANGFCQQSFYTCDQKRTYCASACNIGSCNPLTTCSSSSSGSSGASTSVSCTDSDSRCALWVSNGFCASSLYTCDQKRTYCAASCNIGSCSPMTTCSASSSCTDSDANCPTWVANGFCTKTWYTCNQKNQYCAKSCNIGGCNPQLTCGSGQATTTPTPCININGSLSKIDRYFCNSTIHDYTVSQQNLYSSCSHEDLCFAPESDCQNPKNKTGYLLNTASGNTCQGLLQMVSFNDKSSNSTVLAVGSAEISQFRSNTTYYAELENMGYCAPNSCTCGATLPLYYIVRSISNGIDHLYTLSFDEMVRNNGSVTLKGSYQGIKCYLWTINATTVCGVSC
uniref:ShKT domain-containing protein n=1 Tax=Acrobeloides nanus TaxID=290746 RepID=A0A914D6B8_9BILA